MVSKINTISTMPYKGVRDFYPEDMFLQDYIFEKMSSVARLYGYTEYGASVLEPAELYRAKSGDEIVNEQTYTFKDRGDRDVTLRPEMTPTIARMVAARKRELPMPLRWFSIPNLFRYESPQRGRVREHWQLNVDIFGVSSLDAEVEVISLASDIMKAFGAKPDMFEVRLNSRLLTNYILYTHLALPEEKAHALLKLTDRKDKMSEPEFREKVLEIIAEKSEEYVKIMSASSLDDLIALLPNSAKIEGVANFKELKRRLREHGIQNIRFSPTLTRGFDYYTGTIFEVFDTDPKNRRSLFGGGRYDDLLGVFDADRIPAVGFGMGDVTVADFIDTHGLAPVYKSLTTLYIGRTSEQFNVNAVQLAEKLRQKGISAEVDLSDKKVGEQIKTAVKKGVPYVTIVGDDEVSSNNFKIKRLADGQEEILGESAIADFFNAK
jgi:histidyl-tRNA synthetase